MKLALLCAALAASPSFAAELVAHHGGDTARLASASCENEQILARVQPQVRPALKTASVLVEGQTFQACWGVAGDAVLLLFEDGDEGLIPVSELKPALEA